MMNKKTLMAAAATAFLFLPAAASAQDAQMNNTAPTIKSEPAPLSAAAIDDAKMAEFVEVHQEVQEVGTKYQTEIQEATDAADRNELADKANKEIAEVIADSNLTPEEYNRIASLVQQDPALQLRYKQELQK